MSESNLWGEIPNGEGIRTPTSVLREQIAYLEQGTNGLLTGKLTRSPDGSNTTIVMLIVAPALNNYSFEAIEISHTMSLYPLSFFNHESRNWTRCENEQEFKEVLKKALQSPRIRNVVTGLLAQIKAESD